MYNLFLTCSLSPEFMRHAGIAGNRRAFMSTPDDLTLSLSRHPRSHANRSRAVSEAITQSALLRACCLAAEIKGSGWYRLRRVPPLCQPILLPRILQPIRLAASLTRYKSTLFSKWVVGNVFGWVAATCSDLQLQSARINYIVYAEGSNRSVSGSCAECQHKPPTVSWIILCLWRRVLLPGLGRDTRKSIPDYRYRNTNAGRLMYRYWDTFVCCNRIF